MASAAGKKAGSLFWRANQLAGTVERDKPGSWRLVQEALAVDPNHVDANVLAGDLWTTYYDEIDHLVDASEGARRALPYYERATELAPQHADAWSGLARALNHLRRHSEALVAAEQGLMALPHRWGYLRSEELSRNVAESLCEAKALALAGLGSLDDAIQVIHEGLQRYPHSWYLQEALTELLRSG